MLCPSNFNFRLDDSSLSPLVSQFWSTDKYYLSSFMWLPILNHSFEPFNSSLTVPFNFNSHSWFSVSKSFLLDSHLLDRFCPDFLIQNSDINNDHIDDDNDKLKIIKSIRAFSKPLDTEKIKFEIQKENDKYLEKIRNTLSFKTKQRYLKQKNINIRKIITQKTTPFRAGKVTSLNKKLCPLKTKKIRIYPTSEQKIIFKKWIGACRYIYNKINSDIQKDSSCTDFMKNRDKYIPAKQISENEKWMLDVPKEVRANTISDYCKAINENKKKVKNGKLKSFLMKYKSKKDSKQSIKIPHASVSIIDNKITIYPNILKNNASIKCNRYEKIPKIEYDIILKYEKPNYWYINIPYETNDIIKNITENQGCMKKVIAFDPGIRTCLTGYSPNGHILEIGKRDIEKIIRLCVLIDKMQSKISKKELRCRKRLRILKKMVKLRHRIRRLKEDMHKKTSKYLCANYEIIIIPKFEVSNMIKKANRKIINKTVRQLLNWNHYEFRQTLKMKAKEKGRIIIESNESYTSKTCTNCGNLHENLKGNKIYECKKCGIIIDRDVNGARNILLRALELIL
jgi:putative transposase